MMMFYMCVFKDTAGQERFRTITSSYYRGCHAIILIFDLTIHETFVSTGKWLEEISKFAPESVIVVAAGLNCDDPEKVSVTKEELDSVFAMHNPPIPFFGVSTKTGQGVTDVFTTAARMFIRTAAAGSSPPAQTSSVSKPNAKEKDDKCIIC